MAARFGATGQAFDVIDFGVDNGAVLPLWLAPVFRHEKGRPRKVGLNASSEVEDAWNA